MSYESIVVRAHESCAATGTRRSTVPTLTRCDPAGVCRLEAPQARGGDHRGVVGRQRQARHEHRQLARLASRARVRAQPAVGRHAAGDADAARAVPPRRVEQPIEQRLDDDALEAGADVARSPDRGSGSSSPRPSAARRAVTCRSTAVFSPLKLKSRPARQLAARCDRRGSAASSGNGSRGRCPRAPAGRSTGPPG